MSDAYLQAKTLEIMFSILDTAIQLGRDEIIWRGSPMSGPVCMSGEKCFGELSEERECTVIAMDKMANELNWLVQQSQYLYKVTKRGKQVWSEWGRAPR